LAEAHAVGLVHRDIKPANIMLCDRGGVADFVKVLDFGLAKQLTAPAVDNLSRSTTIVGTPLYLPPEAITGTQAIDARMDLYSLAAVGYFMLTGTPVFDGKTVVEVCVKHLSIAPEPLAARHAGHDAPAELEALLRRCLAKDPAQRPASAEELARALEALPIAVWSPRAARAWWQERGPSVTERANAMRAVDDGGGPTGTLQIDPQGDGEPNLGSTIDRAV
jgi:serine/threonine-protein kinase